MKAEFSHQLKVKSSQRGMCLEKFLHFHLAELSHNQIKRLLLAGKVWVNQKAVLKGAWNLKAKDSVAILDFSKKKLILPQNQKHITKPGGYVDVLYEDPFLIAVNKPAFFEFEEFTNQVQAYLKRTQAKNFLNYLGPMHRLDKETSGILVFTKKKVANTLADQFRKRKVVKEYRALVWGRVAKSFSKIELFLKKLPNQKKRKVFVVDSGKEAMTSQTFFWVLERYSQASLLRLRIKTGRTHQIRVHLEHLGFPIVGDKVYQRGARDCPSFIKRQLLHAFFMEFEHPITKKRLQIEAPLPNDFQKAIQSFQENP